MPKSKEIILTIPPDFYSRLLDEKKKLSYTSVQQVIYDILRKYYLSPQQPTLPAEKKKKSRAGRPKNVDLSEAMTHKPFSGW